MCKNNESIINDKLDVKGKSVTQDNMTRDPYGKGHRKSMRRKKENVFLRDYVF